MRISDWSSDVCSSDLHFLGCLLDLLLVLRRLAHAHVEDDLVDPRHFERVLVTELVGPRLGDLLVVDALHAGRILRSEERRVGKEGVRTLKYRVSPSI